MTFIQLPFFLPLFYLLLSYPTLQIVFRRRVDGSWSMSAHNIVSDTLSSCRLSAKARLMLIATLTTHLMGRAVRLGHLQRQRAFLDIYFASNVDFPFPFIYHLLCFVNTYFMPTACRQNPSSCCPRSTHTWGPKRRSRSQASDKGCLKGDPHDP